MGEPLVGGWGASRSRDGDNGQFCCANGETYNIPIELFESRYGLKVEQYAFHNDDGGAGEFRGGKGLVLDYRVTSDEAFLTYATSRSERPPWAMRGGRPGSLNGVKILRQNGAVEKYDMCTRVRVAKGELIRLTTATGGGFGDPKNRPKKLIESDLKNGFLTIEQAARDYGFKSAERV
jgi:N-methylhydantoinase B